MKNTLAKAYIMRRLSNELPSKLYYHSIDHILDVFQASMRIADLEQISDYERDLLATAVYFHDSGFIYQSLNHEAKGCEIAREILGDFGYSLEEIEIICGMIMATRIPQTPTNRLEQIICDADLDYLGRDDFWVIGNRLFMELTQRNALSSAEEWNLLQAKFLGSHHFFTPSAVNLRQQKKEEHLRVIQEILDTY